MNQSNEVSLQGVVGENRMIRGRTRALAGLFRRTPVHPQWLLGTSPGMQAAIRRLEPGRILDVGCASRWVEQLLPDGSQYIGLDSRDTGQALYGARPDFYADAARLPLSDDRLDAVIILEVVEHLRCPREALSEAARVLKPGGRLLLSMPFLYPIHDAPHDYQRYTRHGLERELEAVGLRVETISPGLRNPALLLAPLLVLLIPLINLSAWLLGRLMPDWPALTAGYQVVARKP